MDQTGHNRIPSLQHEAIQIAQRVAGRDQANVADAIEAGAKLIEIRAGLPRGEWGPWVRSEFPLGKSTAYDWIKIAEHADLVSSSAGSTREALRIIKEKTQPKRGAPKSFARHITERHPASKWIAQQTSEIKAGRLSIDVAGKLADLLEHVATEVPQEDRAAWLKAHRLKLPAIEIGAGDLVAVVPAVSQFEGRPPPVPKGEPVLIVYRRT